MEARIVGVGDCWVREERVVMGRRVKIRTAALQFGLCRSVHHVAAELGGNPTFFNGFCETQFVLTVSPMVSEGSLQGDLVGWLGV